MERHIVGIGGISVWQLLIVLAIIVMIFGTKKLRNMGSDLGAAVKGFRKGMEEEKNDDTEKPEAKALGADTTPSSTTGAAPEKNESSQEK